MFDMLKIFNIIILKRYIYSLLKFDNKNNL